MVAAGHPLPGDARTGNGHCPRPGFAAGGPSCSLCLEDDCVRGTSRSLLGLRKAPCKACDMPNVPSPSGPGHGTAVGLHLQAAHPNSPLPGTPSSSRASGTVLRAEGGMAGGTFLSAGMAGSEGHEAGKQLPQGCSGHQRQTRSWADLSVSHSGQLTLWPPGQTQR